MTSKKEWSAETIKANKYKKLSELAAPIVGSYIEKGKAQYSPVYVIKAKDGQIYKILGCTDLDSKMEQIPFDSEVSISLESTVETAYGNAKLIAEVILYRLENVTE